MLFDLRGRGRRRTIQGIYLFLAVLMGGGLIFFGVGGTGVGLFNNDDNGPTASVSSNAVKQAEKAVKARPNDPTAWANLARRRFQSADYDSNSQVFTNAKQLEAVSAAFKRYQALRKAKGKPDTGLLQQMVQVYSERGLQQYAAAVPVLEQLTAADPGGSGNFQQLAVYAKLAGQDRKSALALDKAASLADGKTAAASVRKAVGARIKQLRQLQQLEAQRAGQSAGATPSAPSSTPAPGG
jgi:hypothetical protein